MEPDQALPESISPTPSWQPALEGSLEDEFARTLSAAAIFFIKNADLYIDLKYDTGTMRFIRQKEK